MDRNEQLFTFIEESPTPYHVVRTISRTLLEEGFQELKEQESWLTGGRRELLCVPERIFSDRIPDSGNRGRRVPDRGRT